MLNAGSSQSWGIPDSEPWWDPTIRLSVIPKGAGLLPDVLFEGGSQSVNNAQGRTILPPLRPQRLVL